MNHRPGPVGASALSRTPSTMHLRPIFWMLPERLLLDGGEAARDVALGRLRIRQVARLVAPRPPPDSGRTSSGTSCAPRRSRQRAATRCSPPVSSVVSPKHMVTPWAYSLSNALPTVGFAPQPEVVSDSPHLVETHRSLSGRSSRAQLARPLHVLLRHLRGAHDRVVVAVLLDAEERRPACRWPRSRRRPSSPTGPRCRSRRPRPRSGSSPCRSACGNAARGRRRTAGGRTGADRDRALDVVAPPPRTRRSTGRRPAG